MMIVYLGDCIHKVRYILWDPHEMQNLDSQKARPETAKQTLKME